jgi:hypothetical protein
MEEGILYRLRARARFAESLGDEFGAWREADAEAVAVRDLEGWLVDGVELARGACQLLAEAEQALVPAGEDGPARFGAAGLLLLDALVALLELVADRVKGAVAQGDVVEGESRLRMTLTETREERSRFVRRWPTDPEAWNRATADIRAGRVHTLAEVRDELRRRRARRNP